MIWLGIVGVGAAAYIIGYFWMSAKSRRIRSQRQSGTLESFRQEFLGSGLHEAAIDRAYSDLTDFCTYHVGRQDVLEGLGFLPEDFEDLVERRCREYGNPDAVLQKLTQFLPIRTVNDYVRFLSALIEMQRR